MAADPTGVPEGVLAYEGGDAERVSRQVLAEAEHGAAIIDPAELSALLEAAHDARSRDRIALSREVLLGAARLKLAEDIGAVGDLAEVRQVVKAHGISLATWDAGVARAVRSLRGRADSAGDVLAQRARAASAAAANDSDLGDDAPDGAKAELLHKRPDLAVHFGEVEMNGNIYRMEPGRMVFGEKNARTGEYVERELARFSAVIVEEVTDRPAPDQDGTRSFTVSVASGPAMQTRRLVVPVAGFQRGEWTDFAAGAGWLDWARGTAPRIASMARALSHPVSVRRFGFTGWAEERGRDVYVHAGGAIGAEGPIEGVTVELTDPADRFRLPAPLGGEELRVALGHLRDLLARVAPAEIFAALLGAVFRAPLGPTSCSIHLAGRTQSGKSTLAGIAQSFFGAAMSGESPPASWLNRATTTVGLTGLLHTVGDAVVFIDEYKMSGGAADATIASKFSDVLQTHFNRAVSLKNNRDGSPRRRVWTRSLMLTTGEAIPAGESLRSRIICLGVDARPTWDNGASFDVRDAVARGASGEYAAVMAAYIRWLADGRIRDLRARLAEHQRDAARRFKFDGTERTEKLLGAVALGLSVFGEFVDDTINESWSDELARSGEALRELVAAQEGTVAEENPARRFLALMRDALASGHCHIAFFERSRRPPPAADLADAWGWRFENDEWRPRGACVGVVKSDLRDAVLFIPTEALATVKNRAHAQGSPFPAAATELLAALDAIGALTRSAKRQGDRGRVRHRIGGDEPRDVLSVRFSALFPTANEDGDDAKGEGESGG